MARGLSFALAGLKTELVLGLISADSASLRRRLHILALKLLSLWIWRIQLL
jgi:hypothetical protein